MFEGRSAAESQDFETDPFSGIVTGDSAGGGVGSSHRDIEEALADPEAEV